MILCAVSVIEVMLRHRRRRRRFRMQSEIWLTRENGIIVDVVVGQSLQKQNWTKF